MQGIRLPCPLPMRTLHVPADEQQPFLWTVLLAGVAAQGTGLTGVVRIDLDGKRRTRQGRFVGDLPCSSAKAHVEAWRLALRAFLETGSVPFPCCLRRRARLLVRSRMPVSSSRPIKVWGCACTMDFAMR